MLPLGNGSGQLAAGKPPRRGVRLRRPLRVLPPPSSRTVMLAGAIVMLAFWLTLGRGYTAA
ncbi:hypothetical protein [Xanthomonas translucens]|uniref:hypothetical protein n=1 Tax=Xanthomonas campestris pv. translucens TaxID=343 RepID=UPI000A57866A|nr:hypothetical protein [Xanthomonas translucens]MCT8271429.1 hypothetical protein [Xanthomonas translucens pv. undulosa]QEN92283.1 hypothetical protein F0H33_01830 [Xanthomonas translucens pv. undulosa]QEO25105.1 hypothetical protein F0H32_01815 [Xanthomonas translucens pv. undulosa]QSQ41795.1 hypothetical protein ISN33_00455 [Xanthomonas translucens pv. translucens]QSQ50355.1 hypothetical protein ISN35_07355 [Xanthomonas translucens pv. undulosa]